MSGLIGRLTQDLRKMKEKQILSKSQVGMPSLINQPKILPPRRNGFQILPRCVAEFPVSSWAGHQGTRISRGRKLCQFCGQSLWNQSSGHDGVSKLMTTSGASFDKCPRESLTTPHKHLFQPSSATRPSVPTFSAHTGEKLPKFRLYTCNLRLKTSHKSLGKPY